ncbi:LacI family DNA-binding transcriptional regulator [Novosphingobium sp. RD2P27]|uniref:LacI family DNA-binding transcriptional regulator n=1 Tax=Novosphingobium kalidii TaxID=3230299 RepID=A0ABV2D1U9_9SPHN
MPNTPSNRRPTLKDLAREAGVSLASASYAVNGNGSVGEQTRAHILSVAQRIGYRQNSAARAMKTGRSGTLALLVPDLTNPFFPALAQAVFRAARAAGYTMFLIDTEGNEALEQAALAKGVDLGVDGIAWFPIRDKDTSAGVLARTPVVVLDRTVPGYAAIGIDYLDAGRIAARHLLDAGHRRIGIISGPTDIASMRDRCDGAEALICGEGALAFRVENAFSTDLEPHAQAAITGGGATAVFAAADVIAIGALRYAQANGLRVPEDVSILGFDDIPLAEQSLPPLSTIELPIEDIAQHAISELGKQIGRPHASSAALRIVHTRTRLVPRLSVRLLG